MIKLIVTDAGHTLGTFNRPGTHRMLMDLSPLPEHVVHEEARRWLHCAPGLTEGIIEGLCNALLIDPARWPRPWPALGFSAYSYTRSALAELSGIAPVVVLSNVPVTCGAHRMAEVRQQCAPYIVKTYTSFGFGMRKPDRRLWQAIGIEQSVEPEHMVHLGDQWNNDILGAVWAGCRAVYVNTRHSSVPSDDRWPPQRERIAVADTLVSAVAHVRKWQEEAV